MIALSPIDCCCRDNDDADMFIILGFTAGAAVEKPLGLEFVRGGGLTNVKL